MIIYTKLKKENIKYDFLLYKPKNFTINNIFYKLKFNSKYKEN